MDSEDFLTTLKRFIARKGRPEKIYCDNRRTFVGAAKWLRNVMQDERVYDYLGRMKISSGNFSSAGQNGGVNNLSEWSALLNDPSKRELEMEPSPGTNFKICCMEDSGPQNDVILASSVFQPSCCVRSLLKTTCSCLYSRQTRFSFDVPTYRLRLRFTTTTTLTFKTEQDI